MTCRPSKPESWSPDITDELIVTAIQEELDATVVPAPHYSTDRKRVFLFESNDAILVAELKSMLRSLTMKRCTLRVSVTSGDIVRYSTDSKKITETLTPESFSNVLFRQSEVRLTFKSSHPMDSVKTAWFFSCCSDDTRLLPQTVMVKRCAFTRIPCPVQAKIRELGGIDNAARQWMSLSNHKKLYTQKELLNVLITDADERRLVTADSNRVLALVVSFNTSLDKEDILTKIRAEISSWPGDFSGDSSEASIDGPDRHHAPIGESENDAGKESSSVAAAKSGGTALAKAAPKDGHNAVKATKRVGESKEAARVDVGGLVEVDEVIVTIRLASVRPDNIVFKLFQEGGVLRHYVKPRSSPEEPHLDLVNTFVDNACRNAAGVKMSGDGDLEYNPIPSVKVIDSGGYVCFDLMFGLAQIAVSRPGKEPFPFLWRLTNGGVVRFGPIVEMDRTVLPLEALNLEEWVRRVFKREGQVNNGRID